MPRYVLFCLLLVVSCSTVVITGSLLSWKWVKSQHTKNTLATIENFRDSNLDNLQRWVISQQDNVKRIAKSPQVHQLATELVSLPQNAVFAEHPIHDELNRWFLTLMATLNYQAFYIIDRNGDVISSSDRSNIKKSLPFLDSLEIKRLYHQTTYFNLSPLTISPLGKTAASGDIAHTSRLIAGATFVADAVAVTDTKMAPHDIASLALVFIGQRKNTKIPGLITFTADSQTILFDPKSHVILRVNQSEDSSPEVAPAISKEIAIAITEGRSTNMSGNIKTNRQGLITSAVWDQHVNIGVLIQIPHQRLFSTLKTLKFNYLISTTFACLLLTGIIIYFANARARLKRANIENLKSEERLTLALEAGNEGIWDWNIQTGEVFYSDKWFTMMGYPIPSGKQTLRTLTNIIHPEDKNDVINKLVKNAAWGNSQSQEFRIKEAKGDWRWVQITGKIVEKDSQGNPARIIHTQRDVTENKNYESKLKSLNDRLEQVVNQQSQELSHTKAELEKILICSGDGILGIDIGGHINFCNPIASVITGYSTEELLGKSEHALLHHHSAEGNAFPEARCSILNSIHSGQTLTVDSEVFWHKSGTNFPVEYTSAPIMDDKDSVKGAVVIFRDISERKAYEIAQREAIIAANEASLAKSNFMANMSHELRTPMNAIIGLSDLLKNSTLSQSQQNYVNKIKAASSSLLNIINDILDFSKIESGDLLLENQAFDLLSSISNVVNLIAQKAEDKHLLFLVDIEDTLPKQVTGDPKRLGQVFTHLLANAIKFTNEGYVRLHIGQDQTQVTFSVIDTGIGISKDRQQEIFNAFTQADNSATRQHGGTGLGLAICKQLVSMMGGELSINSEEGKGSTFSFSLPLSGKDTVVAEEQGDILLISQDHMVRENLRQWLQISGYQCFTRSIDYLMDNLEDLKTTKGIVFDWTISDLELKRLTNVLSSMDIKMPLYNVVRHSSQQRGHEIRILTSEDITFPVCDVLHLS